MKVLIVTSLILVFAVACGDSKKEANNNGNNSSGIQCQVKEDCSDQLDGALVPENVDCRLDPETGKTGCYECIDESECPDYYRCELRCTNASSMCFRKGRLASLSYYSAGPDKRRYQSRLA